MIKAKLKDTVYLGDSVYIDYINNSLRLTTNNGYPDDPRNVIYLESEVYEALVLYVKNLDDGLL